MFLQHRHRMRLVLSYASLSLYCSLSTTLKCESSHFKHVIDTNKCITISYVTDIEGNLDYWKRFIRISRILDTDTEGKLLLKENCHLVFGGDVVDRGAGDIRVAQDLLDIKSRYPNRVHFILGNRDVNKMRLLVETDPKLMQNEHLVPYWKYQNNEKVKRETIPTESVPKRIQWILKQSMGCPITFEERRKELQELHLPSTDEDVAQSFLNSMKPNGFLAKFMQHGQLGLVMHDTLFIHGAVRKNTLGYFPFKSNPALPRTENIRQWVAELNAFAKEETSQYRDKIEEYIQNMAENDPNSSWSTTGGYLHPQPGSRLIHTGMGWNADQSINPSIIYSNFLSKDGQPTQPSQDVLAYCKRENIRRIIVGHQPVGDVPLIIDANDVKVICGDTSYANDVKWSSSVDTSLYNVNSDISPAPVDSTRGVAVSEILLSIPQDKFETDLTFPSTVTIHGVLSNGIMHEQSFTNSLNYVGKPMEDNWWVKTILPVKDSLTEEVHLLVARKEGYGVTNDIVAATMADTASNSS